MDSIQNVHIVDIFMIRSEPSCLVVATAYHCSSNPHQLKTLVVKSPSDQFLGILCQVFGLQPAGIFLPKA